MSTMVWNKGIKTGLVPKTAFKKGHKLHLNWQKKFDRGEIGFQKGYTPWNKNLSPEDQPGYKGGRQKTGNGYVQLLMPAHPFADKRGRVFEHRYLMEQKLGRYLKKTEMVDHTNGIRDDNRIENLRFCTQTQNLSNRGKPITNTSGYKNISYSKLYKKYIVQITYKKKTHCLGSFKILTEAVIARNKAAIEILGEFAKLE